MGRGRAGGRVPASAPRIAPILLDAARHAMRRALATREPSESRGPAGERESVRPGSLEKRGGWTGGWLLRWVMLWRGLKKRGSREARVTFLGKTCWPLASGPVLGRVWPDARPISLGRGGWIMDDGQHRRGETASVGLSVLAASAVRLAARRSAGLAGLTLRRSA